MGEQLLQLNTNHWTVQTNSTAPYISAIIVKSFRFIHKRWYRTGVLIYIARQPCSSIGRNLLQRPSIIGTLQAEDIGSAKPYTHHQVLIRRQPQPLGHSTHFTTFSENQKYKPKFFGKASRLGNYYFQQSCLFRKFLFWKYLNRF